jgi:GrpB-like predicted nucleotidyltransferase (UPF0157 family)
VSDPLWAYEKPDIHPYDPDWARRGELERDRLTAVLGTAEVEHVGSTSVPGLAAKPVIDLMTRADDLDVFVTQARDRLAADGWCYVPPELDRRPWRRLFVKPDKTGQRRLAHLHIIEAGHPRWERQLAFRDALRQDPGLAARYADLKRRLAAEHPGDREAYTNGKAAFIAGAIHPSAR